MGSGSRLYLPPPPAPLLSTVGLGLSGQRKGWMRWSLRALPAVAFSVGTEGRRTDLPGGPTVCQVFISYHA